MTNKNMKNYIIRAVRFLPAIAMMLVIFYFSSMPGEASSDTSSFFLEPLIKMVEGTSHHQVAPEAVEVLHTLIRKLAHFSEYAFLAGLVILAIYTSKISKIRVGVFAEIITALYAISDEIHQSFVPERSPSPVDVGIDSLGGLTGIVLVFLVIGAVNKSRKRKMENENL